MAINYLHTCRCVNPDMWRLCSISTEPESAWDLAFEVKREQEYLGCNISTLEGAVLPTLFAKTCYIVEQIKVSFGWRCLFCVKLSTHFRGWGWGAC